MHPVAGLVYRAMGFPPQFFTVLFAIPRVTGYLAHWRESLTDPDTKIIRPQQDYQVGLPPTMRACLADEHHLQKLTLWSENGFTGPETSCHVKQHVRHLTWHAAAGAAASSASNCLLLMYIDRQLWQF